MEPTIFIKHEKTVFFIFLPLPPSLVREIYLQNVDDNVPAPQVVEINT
jgi:hypothetical protein